MAKSSFTLLFLLTAVGCAEPDLDARRDAALADTGDTRSAPRIPSPELVLVRLLGHPMPAPGSPHAQHHATVAVRPDGTALIAWSEDDAGRMALLGRQGAAAPLALNAPVDHLQVRADPVGWTLVASEVDSDALVAAHLDAQGELLDGLTEIAAVGRFPDAAIDEDGDAVAVSTDLDTIVCTGFDAAMKHVLSLPCASRVHDDRFFGTSSIAKGDGGNVVTWTEFGDGGISVHVEGPAGAYLVDEMPWGSRAAGRPMLVVTDAGHLVTWRDAAPDGIGRSFVQSFSADGDPGPRLLLGSAPDLEPTNMPALSSVLDGRVLVAWEEAGSIQVQVRDAATGGALGPPTVIGDAPHDAHRASIGWTKLAGHPYGVVTWSSFPATGEPRELWMQRFRVVPLIVAGRARTTTP